MANSNIHSPLLKSDSNNCLRREYPADLLKFNAYIKPANSFEEACEIIKKKKLVLGEPAVVPFKYTNSDGTTQHSVDCRRGNRLCRLSACRHSAVSDCRTYRRRQEHYPRLRVSCSLRACSEADKIQNG